MPITDLLSGVTSIIPGPGELIDGAPAVADELTQAGKRAAGVGVDTATSLPEAGKGLAEDLGDGVADDDTKDE